MQFVDWLWLIHPALAVVVVYPLLGMVLRAARQTRDQRVLKQTFPAAVGKNHADLGTWLTTTVTGIVLLAEVVVITTANPLAEFSGGPGRLFQLFLVLVGSIVAFLALLNVRKLIYRSTFALLCWIGILTLGMQPEVFRRSDNPLDPEFWQSHYWGGIVLTGLMLISLAMRYAIYRNIRWRRLHLSLNIFAALIFVVQGISGPRDLLEIPLSWQKSTIYSCNFDNRTCPQPSDQASPLQQTP